MATIPLFASWTWKRSLPEPFDKVSSLVSTTHYSSYCMVSTKKSTLHPAFLSALLAYMEMDTTLTPASSSECAIGTQDGKIIAEYKSRTGEIHAVVFNKKTGKFNVGRFDDPASSPRVYTVKESANTGTALFFALIPEAMTDSEFEENYKILGKCKNDGFTDMDEAERAAFILSDNIYRRISSAGSLGNAGIPLSFPSTGNLQNLTTLNLQKGAYSPKSVLYGTFQVLTATSSAAAAVIDKKDFVNHFSL